MRSSCAKPPGEKSVIEGLQTGELAMIDKNACLLSGAILVLGGQVQAQESSGIGVEEIIVTAQRREEGLQDVPLAVSAVSGAELQDRGLNDMRDVLALTPGAAFTSTNAAEPVLSIRGIASGGEGAVLDSGVLMLIDGEVISRDFLRSAPIFDIQRVEVLRGPQGTTYGRNATAGVLHVISRRPDAEAGGEIGIDVGDYGAATLNAGFDLPIGKSTLSRLALHYNRRDGYSEDVATGQDVDDRESVAGRLTVEQRIGNNLTNTVRVHFSQERHGDTAPLKSFDPTRPLLGSPFRPSYTEPSTDPFKVVTTPGGSFFDRDVWGLSNQLGVDFGGSKLTSLTSYRSGDNDFFQSSPIGINNQTGRNEADIFSQELRLEGSVAQGQLGWVTGVFFIDEEVRYGFDRTVIAATNFPPSSQQLRHVNNGRGYGVFGELLWDITSQFTLTVGGRYSRDEKDFRLDNRAQGPFASTFVADPSQPLIASVSDTWGKPTGRVSLQYRLNDALMVYGTVSQGYKSGGFNSEPLNLQAATTPFDEETVLNGEIGVRSELFDNRLRFNVTAFEMRFDDIQVQSFTSGFVEITSNAASATIRGVEVEAVARPSRYLMFSLGAAAYDGEFDDYIDLNGNQLAGTALAKMPDWTLATSAVLESPSIADAGVLRFRADYTTRSDIAHDAPADRVFGIREGKDLVDVRLDWLPAGANWRAGVFARNLLDEREMQYIYPRGVLRQRLVSYGPPRTYGVSLSYEF
jgi:iron complex outermembrane recepter protein